MLLLAVVSLALLAKRYSEREKILEQRSSERERMLEDRLEETRASARTEQREMEIQCEREKESILGRLAKVEEMLAAERQAHFETRSESIEDARKFLESLELERKAQSDLSLQLVRLQSENQRLTERLSEVASTGPRILTRSKQS